MKLNNIILLLFSFFLISCTPIPEIDSEYKNITYKVEEELLFNINNYKYVNYDFSNLRKKLKNRFNKEIIILYKLGNEVHAKAIKEKLVNAKLSSSVLAIENEYISYHEIKVIVSSWSVLKRKCYSNSVVDDYIKFGCSTVNNNINQSVNPILLQ